MSEEFEDKIRLWRKQFKEWKPMEPCKELRDAVKAVELHREPGHPIQGKIIRAYADKFGVDADLITQMVSDTFPWEK